MKKSKYHYSLRRSVPQNGYAHVYVTLHRSQSTSSDDELIELQWQCDQELDRWYGLSISINSRRYLEQSLAAISEASSLLARIVKTAKKDSVYHDDKPLTLIAVLEQLNIPRMILDDRVSQYLPPDQVKPSEYGRWMSLDEHGSCIGSVLARDEDEARRLLFAAMAQDAESEYRQKKFEAWIAAGKRVELDHYRAMPDTRPIEEICRPLKEPQSQAA